jgi:diguanylate cyclase (GGDEF)-like protein
MHKLLQRQLNRFAQKGLSFGDNQADFLKVISDYYDEIDQEIKLLENAIDLSSVELNELNQKILAQASKDKQNSAETIWNKTYNDPVTGLPNRRMMRQRLVHNIALASRNNYKFVLLYIDFDNFKDINDTLGHRCGDELLQIYSKRLRDLYPDIELFHLGGDKFSLIIEREANEFSENIYLTGILTALKESHYIGTLDKKINLSASIGIAIFPDDSNDPEKLLMYAEQAVYKAKEMGDRYRYFKPEMQAAAQEREQLRHEIWQAKESNQLKVYYQPIVDVFSGRIVKAEALLRWIHPQHGFISPDKFIPIAEDSGALLDIGDWVFRESTSFAKRMTDKFGHSFSISVNKSPAQFKENHSYFNSWANYLDFLGLPGEHVSLEITEGMLMNNNQEFTDVLKKFRALGVKISIDDFGIGYSSLSYFKKFEIDFIKIDKSFVDNLINVTVDQVLCESIITIAHKLGIKVIAEGVETIEQLTLLQQYGCDLVQGYLFSKPIPEDEFEKLLLT